MTDLELRNRYWTILLASRYFQLLRDTAEYDPAAQLEQPEDCHGLLDLDGDVIASELCRQFPAARWYR